MFFDLRRYFFANLIALGGYAIYVYCIKASMTYFPPPVLVHTWGEPTYEYSDIEYQFMLWWLTCVALLLVFFVAFIAEFIIRFILDKYVFKKTESKLKKLPKALSIIYSTLFYIGFLPGAAIIIYIVFGSLISIVLESIFYK